MWRREKALIHLVTSPSVTVCYPRHGGDGACEIADGDPRRRGRGTERRLFQGGPRMAECGPRELMSSARSNLITV
jgi:hypothetical protein